MATLEHVISDAFTEDYWNITLPNELATSATRSPALFAYYAALNLLNAQVLFSRLRVPELLDPASRSHRASLERHHLFPQGYLKSVGVIRQRDINQIANYALVEWSDNLKIGKTGPAEYYPRYAATIEPDLLKQMCFWHGLPQDWHLMEYNQFLEARRRLLANVIRRGFDCTSTASPGGSPAASAAADRC